MAIVYNKLFTFLDEQGIKKYHLRQQGIHAAVMDKLVKNSNVDISTINKLCKLLNCQPSDIMEYIPDDETDS
ncbi:MAG: helix-turn-helix transcriptional regulator [Oscillospiraceae bacterium]|nr:helix-turn-helix transcriptional regulator [Oscillospiraceae bacterium]